MKNITAEAKQLTQTILASKQLFISELKNAKTLLNQNRLDLALDIAANISTYAYLNFTSFYVSYELEQLIQKIGEQLVIPAAVTKEESNGKRRILHVASELYELGGHTPLLLKWIQRDKDSEHTIFLTRQSASVIPSKIFATHEVDESIICHTNEGKSAIQTAQHLLDVSSQYDFIVLHIHPNDIVPLLAFSRLKPVPVYFLNHADHCFWLGASMIDGLIQLRHQSIELDKIRRGMEGVPQFVLPIPVNAAVSSGMNKEDVLRKYRVDKQQSFVLLTTSTESKFKPLLEYNYFESVIPVLDQNPHVVLFVVGISADKELALKYSHPQIKYLGYLDPVELSGIEDNVDLYLETFPNSSFTALLQVLMKGKPVHFMFSPPALFQLFSEEAFYAKDQLEWQQLLNERITDIRALGDYAKHVSQTAINEYSIEAWQLSLKKIYEYADNTSPSNKFNFKRDSAFCEGKSDLFLSGISLKEHYQFSFFENEGRFVRFKRIISFLEIYIKVYPERTQIMDYGIKHVLKSIKGLLRS